MEIGILVMYVMFGTMFGVWSSAVSETRSIKGGFWWGFFLGVIGVIIVYASPLHPNEIARRQLAVEKAKEQLMKNQPNGNHNENKEARYSA